MLRRGLTNPRKILFGFALVVLGLYAFVVGLKLGLFPIGTSMARQLMSMEGFVFVYLSLLSLSRVWLLYLFCNWSWRI